MVKDEVTTFTLFVMQIEIMMHESSITLASVHDLVCVQQDEPTGLQGFDVAVRCL